LDVWLEAFKDRPAKAIGHAAIQKSLAELKVGKGKKGENPAPTTRNRYLSTLSASFTLAVRNKRVDENPCKYVKKLKENNSVTC